MGTEDTSVDQHVVALYEDEVQDVDQILLGIEHQEIERPPGLPAVGVVVEEGKTDQALLNFRSHDAVDTAYRGQEVTWDADATPNDPRLDDQWGPDTVDLPQAWNTTYGSQGVEIGVIDKGISGHDDLDANLCGGSGGSEPHGTRVAGVAGAVTDNGIGIAGTSDACLVDYPAIRGFDDMDGFPQQDLATSFTVSVAILEATYDGQVDVISMSLSTMDTPLLEAAVQEAHAEGIFLAASSGNDAEDCSKAPQNYAEVMGVGAIDEAGDVPYCNGEIFAPGWGVLTTDHGGGYGTYSGTSFAAPFVSGTAALMLDVAPGLAPDDIQDQLEATADGSQPNVLDAGDAVDAVADGHS